jgi:membrane fusion protein (multidrug efflux system)
MYRLSKDFLFKHKLIISTTILIAVVAMLVMLTTLRGDRTAKAAPAPLEVEVITVEEQSVPIYTEWVGTTDGMVNADIKAQVTGYLLRQDYKEGSLVKKGQLLFEIDPRPFQAVVDQANGQLAQYMGQLEQANAGVLQAEALVASTNSQLLQAQAQVSQAKANQTKTQLDVDKYRPLAAQKAVTQQDLDNAVQTNAVSGAQVEAANAGVETARAQMRAATAQLATSRAAIATVKGQIENARAVVKTAELNLGFTRILSPIDGVAGIAQAQVGNLISTNSSPLTTVSTVDPIKVYFTLNERDYLKYSKTDLIRAGHGTSVAQLQLELVLADGSEYPESGSFFFADRQVDQKTGAIRAAGIFPNPGNVLRPGQFARVRAVTDTRDAALLVPQRAVTELQGSYQVAVVGAENKVDVRTVKVGEKTGNEWIITEGLKPGERVIAEGTQKVRPGITVAPKPFVNHK